ncbi:hypothetical protein BC830DRAFT_658097 [Chytriomyces sp. MP71]|nr:hypothetical protein BC830DRAFT_658097 [Chytriomyces sp. MP71]
MTQTQPPTGDAHVFDAAVDERRPSSSSSFAAESFFVQFQQNHCVSAACSPLSLPTPVSALAASDEHVLSVVVGAMGPAVLEPPPRMDSNNNSNNNSKNNSNNNMITKMISARRPVSDLHASAISHSYAVKVGSVDTISSQESSIAGSFSITPSTNHFISDLIGNVTASDSGCAVDASFQSPSLSPSQSNKDCRSSPPLLLSPHDESHNESVADEDENLDHWNQNPFMNHRKEDTDDFAISTTDSDGSYVEDEDDEVQDVRICVGSLASNSSTLQMIPMQHPHSMTLKTAITSTSLSLTDSDSDVLPLAKKFRSGSASIPIPSPSRNNTPERKLHPELEIVRNEDTSYMAPASVERRALAKSWAPGGDRKSFMEMRELPPPHRQDPISTVISTVGSVLPTSYQKWKQHQQWSNNNPARSVLLKCSQVSGSPTRPEFWASTTSHTIYPDAYELFSSTFYGSSCPVNTQNVPSLVGSRAAHLLAHKPRLAELARVRRFLANAPEGSYKPLEPAVFDDLVARGDVTVQGCRVVAVRGVEEVRREEERRYTALVEQYTPAPAGVVRKSSLSEAARRAATTERDPVEPVVRKKKSYKRMLVMGVDNEELVFDEAESSAAALAPPSAGLLKTHVKEDKVRHVSFASEVQVADGTVARLDDSPKIGRVMEFRRRAMARAVKGLELIQPREAVAMDFCAASRPVEVVVTEELDDPIVGTCSWISRLFGACFGVSASSRQEPAERVVKASTPLLASTAPSYNTVSRPQIGGFEGLFVRDEEEDVRNLVGRKELKWSDDESSEVDGEDY